MSWSYDPGQLATSALMQARLLIGDTIPGRQLAQDEEITWTLSKYSNAYSGCAEICRNISIRFATQVDTVQGELRTTYGQITRQFALLSKDFEMRGLRGAVPYAGGISIQDKQRVEQDTDRVPPAFQREQFDDRLPVGSVGEQTQDFGLPDTTGNE